MSSSVGREQLRQERRKGRIPAAKPPQPVPAANGKNKLLTDALHATDAAKENLFKLQADDHWHGELQSNVTITAEYVLLCQALELDLSHKAPELIRYLWSQQKDDGGWAIAHGLSGDISTTAETYCALRILGVEVTEPRLRKAEVFVRSRGGLEKMRMLTRINFALFGLVPWSSVPMIPPELILLPSQAPMNIYRFASWARTAIVPLSVLFHHKPIFALPNGRSETNHWLDQLWLDPERKHLPHPMGKANLVAGLFAKLQPRFISKPVRELSLRKCEEWILAHQEKNGDWGGTFFPAFYSVLALAVNGYSVDSDPVRLGVKAIENDGVADEQGVRIQLTRSPISDTALALTALLDAGADAGDRRITAAREWLERRQLFVNYGDWQVYSTQHRSGGWSFCYHNSWYPDVLDTSVAAMALLKQNPASKPSNAVQRAVAWVLGMQNRDGGWAMFDRQNDGLLPGQFVIPGCEALCEVSSPDVTGRALEFLGMVPDPRARSAAKRALQYLRRTQERQGAWFGRWGVNYLYGTSSVVCGLARMQVPASDAMVEKALHWLKATQNADGGWGETLGSYDDKTLMGRGESAASQTAWALLALLSYLPASDPAVRGGVRWLIDHQNAEGPNRGSWDELVFTRTGLPRHFYFRHDYYRHYFPLMALGRFCQSQLT